VQTGGLGRRAPSSRLHPSPLSPSRLSCLVAVLLLVAGLVLGTSTPAAAATYPLKAPTGLSVTASPSAFTATWNAVAGASHYKLKYSTKRSFKKPVYAQSDTTEAQVGGLKPETAYYVRVRVVDAANQPLSKYSSIKKITTPPVDPATSDVPTGLALTASDATSVSLAWDSRGAGTHYRVKYSTSKTLSDPSYLRTETSSAEITKLSPNTSYYVTVRQVTSLDEPLTAYSAVLKVTTGGDDVLTGINPLRAGSYNIRCANCGNANRLANELPWSGRKDAVVATIKGQNLDVIGIQEASQGWLKNSSGNKIDKSQFEDLIQGLGSPYALTNTARNNCVKSTTPSSCKYKDQGASQGTKIIYNTKRLKMLSAGSRQLTTVDSSSNDRYVAWAIFQQKDSKKKFFFASTHLTNEKDSGGSTVYYEERKTQAREILATVNTKNVDHLPTVIVGDFNSYKWLKPSNGPYEVMLDAGYVDPLGNAYESTTTTTGATVENRIRTWLSSYNNFERKVRGFPKNVNGTYIDYILTTPMKVTEWETVVNMDSDGNFIGVIPSDHNLIRATLWIP
jgi:endonuclease/exonuclease/phosphatase family metal-dependent hydrolase